MKFMTITRYKIPMIGDSDIWPQFAPRVARWIKPKLGYKSLPKWRELCKTAYNQGMK